MPNEHPGLSLAGVITAIAAVVSLGGCVVRTGPMPLEQSARTSVVDRRIQASSDGSRGDGTTRRSVGLSWREHTDLDGGLGLPSEAWPVRLPMPSQTGESTAEVHLILPAQRAPDRREHVGARGLGIVERVRVEELTDDSSLARLRRDLGFDEWLVVQTLRAELRPTIPPAGVSSVSAGATDFVAIDGPDDSEAGRTPRVRLFEAAETSFALYLPNSEPRGLVLQMTNLAGNTDFERRLAQAFRAEGWAVLATFVPDGWALLSGNQIDATDDPRDLGRLIAAIVDDRLAEWAYGVEAVLEDLAIRRPEITQRPLVGIGSSVGAMALPAVSARLVRPFDALVLAGGGADTLEIMRSTTMNVSTTPLQWRNGRRPTSTAWAQIREAYRSATRLDALHTARLLRGVPVLQLHAKWDAIVPAATGDELWEALGRPERWSYRAGHVGLLVFWLPRERSKLVDWVDRAVSPERSSDDAS